MQNHGGVGVFVPIQADKHYKSNELGCSDFSQIIVRDIGGGW